MAEQLDKPSSPKPGLQQPAFPPSKYCYMFTDNDKPVFRYNEVANSFEIVEVHSPLASLVFNYGCAVEQNATTVYICGGLNKYSDAISSAFLIFNPLEQTLTDMPPMLRPRYSFSAVLLGNKFYVLGGRTYGTDQEAIYRNCEVFDFASKSWSEIASMKERRCSFQAMVYKDEIWVLGGYTDINTRSTIIEKYNPKTNTWTKLPFRLQLGSESGHLISLEDNKVILFGGQSLLGSTNYCHEIDLQRGTVLNNGLMPYPCCMGKVFVTEKFAYVFAEDDRGVEVFQAFNLQSRLWETFLPNNLNLIMTGFKKVSIGAPTLVVKHSESMATTGISPAVCQRSVFLFGTEDEPFIVGIDKATFDMRTFACPLELRLKNYQGVCRISDTQVFFTGGVNRELTRASRYTYILDLATMQVAECDSSHYTRFAFETVLLGSFVYVLGGRQLGELGVTAFNKCERFNLLTRKWERIQSMHFSRSSAMTAAIKGKIYVAGGFHADGLATAAIESFDPVTEEWTLHQLALPLPIEAGISYYDSDSDQWVMTGGKSAIDLMDSILTVTPPVTAADAPLFNSDAFIVQSRCLHKAFVTEAHVVIFGGTDQFARFSEVLDRRSFHHDDELTAQLQNSIRNTLAKLNFNGNFLRPNSLA